MKHVSKFAAVALMLACCGVARADENVVDAKSVASDQALIAAVEPSLAVVEFTLKTDNGEEPYGGGWASRCPSCGQFHGTSLNGYMADERPMQVPGFVLSDTEIVVVDPMVNARFLQSINVRRGDTVVPAKIDRYFTDHRAVLLKLEKPLPGAKPLDFAPGDDSKLKSLTYGELNARWLSAVSPISLNVSQTPAGPRITSIAKDSLVVTPEGKAVGVVFSESLPPDGSWKGSPLQWKSRDPAAQQALVDKIKAASDEGVVRVHLSFRSPRANPNDPMAGLRGMRGMGGETNSTEQDVHGLVMSDNTVLVLATLKPDVTARLERVTIHTAAGTSTPAKFKASLQDYGAFVVTPDSPLKGVLAVTDIKPDDLIARTLTLAEVRLAGENRTDYLSRFQLSGLRVGWRSNLYPEAPFNTEQQKNGFLFDENGKLVAFPLIKRPKPTARESYSSESPTLTLASQLAPIVNAGSSIAVDTNNVPLSEAEENRLAWLGVELQALTEDLARLNKVSALTEDGEKGALVTYVYPDSPAAKAGIEVGAVLLRLNVPDQVAPIDIAADEYTFAEREFPWQQYDQFPEAFFDRMPNPWPTAGTTLNRTLTEIGFGKTVTLDLFQAGKQEQKPITIAQSPDYYDSVEKQKHTPTGLTVRPMTFEVRRYFQLKPDAPGVIISAIEPGSRASKAGLKPYEFVTQVNGRPVKTPADFLAAAEGQKELRLDVTRMSKTRVVKLAVDAPGGPTTGPSTAPTSGPAATPIAEPDGDKLGGPTTKPTE